MTVLPHVPQEQMTRRGRAYLLALSAFALSLAFFLLIYPEFFDAPGFRIIRAVFDEHLWAWGILWLWVGAAAGYAGWVGHEVLARVVLIAAASLMAGWAVGFWIAFRLGGPISPVGVLLCTWGAAENLIQCADPMRSPFETIVREVADNKQEP